MQNFHKILDFFRRTGRRASRSCSNCSWRCSSPICTVGDLVGPPRRTERRATTGSRPRRHRPRRANRFVTEIIKGITRRWVRLRSGPAISTRVRGRSALGWVNFNFVFLFFIFSPNMWLFWFWSRLEYYIICILLSAVWWLRCTCGSYWVCLTWQRTVGGPSECHFCWFYSNFAGLVPSVCFTPECYLRGPIERWQLRRMWVLFQ